MQQQEAGPWPHRFKAPFTPRPAAHFPNESARTKRCRRKDDAMVLRNGEVTAARSTGSRDSVEYPSPRGCDEVGSPRVRMLSSSPVMGRSCSRCGAPGTTARERSSSSRTSSSRSSPLSCPSLASTSLAEPILQERADRSVAICEQSKSWLPRVHLLRLLARMIHKFGS